MLKVTNLVGFGAGGEPSAPGLAASLDFETSSSQWLSRLQDVATDNTRMTFSFWMKLETISTSFGIISAQTGIANNPSNLFLIDGSGTMCRQVQGNYGLGGFYSGTKTNDTNWKHICVAHDASQAGTDKTKYWINGVQVTTMDYDGRSGWTNDPLFSGTGNTCYVGRKGDAAPAYFDGLLADIIHCDGQAYGANTFGQDVAGTWTRKKAPGPIVYGANGWRLDGSGAVGTDVSGNGNNFTNNGGVVTSIIKPPEI